MTIAELVGMLVGHPADLRVVVNGYEDGYDDLSPGQVSRIRIALNTGKHEWEGRHGDPDDGTPEDDEVVEVLLLRRVSNWGVWRFWPRRLRQRSLKQTVKHSSGTGAPCRSVKRSWSTLPCRSSVAALPRS